MRRAAILLVLLGGCATAQSARVLPRGRTDVTIAIGDLTRVDEITDERDPHQGSRWFGHVAVRRGITERVDVAAVLARTPGNVASTTFLALEPKLQLTPARMRTTVSIGVMTGLAWSEFVLPAEINPRRVFDREAYVIAPAAYVGYDLSPAVELIAAPRCYLFLPARPDDETDTGVGGALGVRYRGDGGAWVVHPELAFSTAHDASFVTLAVALSIGR